MVAEFPMADAQHQDHQITSVSPACSDGWFIGLDDGFTFFCPKESPIEPKVGMRARLYGKGFGFTVRGLFLDGRKVFYRTEAEQQQQHEREHEQWDQERRYDFERRRPDLDKRFSALPAAFQARITRFRKHSPDFRWQHEGYELAVCGLAARIANHLRLPHHERTTSALRETEYHARVNEFRNLPYEQQKVIGPEFFEGISGNQAGCAMKLAYLFLTRPELVEKEHAAICPLVGCEEMGCYALHAQPHKPLGRP